MESDFNYVVAGDILLTRSHTLSGKINALYQRFRRSKQCGRKIEFIPTHAALALSDGNIIQSNKLADRSTGRGWAKIRAPFQLLAELWKSGPDAARRHPARNILGYGVSVDSLADFIKGLSPRDVLLLRHPDLKQFDSDLFAGLLRESLYHVDMPYNFLVELSEGRGTAVFCSQLVYQVFCGAGIDVPKDVPNRVLPIDLLNWAHRDGWKIVSGETVFNTLEQHSPADDYSAKAIQQSVDLHRAVVERLRQSGALHEALDAFNAMVEESVSKREPTRFTADSWMEIDAKPVPVSTQGLLIAIEKVREAAGKLVALDSLSSAADIEAPNPPSDPIDKPLSWLLNTATRVRKTDVKNLDAREIAANRFLDFGDDILCELNGAAKQVLSILTESQTGEIPENLADDLKARFLESLALKRFLFVAQFIQRLEAADALEAMVSDILERQASILRKNTEIIGELRSEPTQKLLQDETLGIFVRIRLLRLYALAYDFVSAAQWLKVYDGATSLDATIKFLADENYPVLVECFTHLSDLPKQRVKILKIELALRGDQSASEVTETPTPFDPPAAPHGKPARASPP
jgi:hypothetical protein